MSLPIDIRAHSGYKLNERPISFCLDDDVIDIAEVEDHWYDQHAEYFKVRSTKGKRYLLRCSRDGDWTLQSGFDGDELLARPNTSVVAVDPVKVRAFVLPKIKSRAANTAGASKQRSHLIGSWQT